MPRFEHLIQTDYRPSFRTEKVVGMFDVPVEKKLSRCWNVDLPIEDMKWSIGLIVGASGAGKTTIARRAFEGSSFFEKHEWDDTSILNSFANELSIREITDALSHVGFSSPPAWLLPYAALSNGQKFRVDLARAILETKGTLVFDEFSSVVDRTVAKVASFAVSKFIRKMKRQFVAVSCHYDIAEWLEPDWTYDISACVFEARRLRRPAIVAEVKNYHHVAWRLFSGHHYLSASMNKTAKMYMATIEGQPASMTAILPFPHPVCKNTWREHRTVTLPDFQGIGLGNKLSEHVGDLLLKSGKRYISTSSHPAIIHYRAKSSKWRMTRNVSHSSKTGRTSGLLDMSRSTDRLSASFEYVGDRA